jgi:SAM-dependent methyltransferase
VTLPYRESAVVYDALFRKKDYRRASRTLVRVVRRVMPHARTLLDVGCGTGRHLEHLRGEFHVEGLDQSRQMLTVARERCSDIRFHHGTLVDFNLDRQFDAVTCLFGAIAYAKTFINLRKAIRCLARHLRPAGVLVLEPWISPERYVTGRLVFDRVDDANLKVARMYITKRRGAVSVFDSQYIMATASGVVHFTERQELGLFTDEQYREAFHKAGLKVIARGPELFGYGLYVCRRSDDFKRRDTVRRRPSGPRPGIVG